MAKRGKVDFRDILTDAEFAVFARLRAARKERADADGIPAYAVFTNEQLAEMVQKRITSATALRDILALARHEPINMVLPSCRPAYPAGRRARRHPEPHYAA